MMARILLLTGVAALLLPLAALAPASAIAPNSGGAFPVADGKTPTLTPEGTLIVPPPGSPMLLVAADPSEVTIVTDALSWGPADITEATVGPGIGPGTPIGEPTGGVGVLACTNYRAGWYETNDATIWGGHMGVIPANMPPTASNYCSGTGMGYTDAVSFGGSNWIQAGIVLFPNTETSAKWMCQSNNNGVLDTRYGTANSYANGATIYTWFARDSGGVWRTYRYDTGPFAIELGCTLTRTTSGNLQTFGEIQGGTSTAAAMGPWSMFDLRYLDTDNQWYRPSQVQAFYPGSTPCPPYGAGTVSGGTESVGSGKACTTGTSPYPN
ncbi:MAG: hypothetical protein WDA16_12815 [Candidatus Thermoplasmatota archaeon]